MRVGRAARRLQRRDQHLRIQHEVENRRNVLGTRQRLVALDIYVSVGRNAPRHFPYPVGAAAMRAGSYLRVPSVLLADREHLVRVSRDDDIGELRTAQRCLDDMREHGTSGDLAQDFPRQTSRAKPGGNDGDRAHELAPKLLSF